MVIFYFVNRQTTLRREILRFFPETSLYPYFQTTYILSSLPSLIKSSEFLVYWYYWYCTVVTFGTIVGTQFFPQDFDRGRFNAIKRRYGKKRQLTWKTLPRFYHGTLTPPAKIPFSKQTPRHDQSVKKIQAAYNIRGVDLRKETYSRRQ